MQTEASNHIRRFISDPVSVINNTSALRLRKYQLEVAVATVESILEGQGRSFVVMFPRQSGKNELQAQLECYLLLVLSQRDAEIIKVSPTWKPQSLNAMRRLERVLKRSRLTRGLWEKESGYIYRIGRARIFFLSGAPEAHIVGATASTLLEVDEAQDVQIAKYDRDIAPMAASTNATRIFWGTAWTSRTLLARELRAAREAERRDGARRVFVLTADDVAAEVPAYGMYVAEQVARLGRSNPLVKSQFFSEEIDSDSGMFPPARRALMQGQHARLSGPQPGKIYALLLDVAGEDEAARSSGAEDGGSTVLQNPGRDATALTVVEVDLSSLQDPIIKAPTYKVVDCRLWVGVKHTLLYGQIRALVDLWRARTLVVDATGVGAGLASFLVSALGAGRVKPFLFNRSTKSRLGWDFLSVCETGRFKYWAALAQSGAADPEAAEFWRQVENCEYSVQPGPGQVLTWGVPNGARDSRTGDLLHDDLIISAALCAQLDPLEWYAGGPSGLVQRADPITEMDGEGF